VRGEAALLETCRDVLKRARRGGADAAEVFATAREEARVELETDDVARALTHDEESFGIRVRARGSTGFSATNDLSPEALDRAVEAALELARVSPADTYDELPAPRRLEPVAGLRDAALEELDIEVVGRLCGELAARTRELDARARIDSGSVCVAGLCRTIASSTGMEAFERSTDASVVLFGMAVEGERVGSFDHVYEQVRARKDLDEALAATPERFVHKVVSALGAGPGESFRGTLVLTPEAVADFLLPLLTAALSAQAVRTGRSPLAGKRGERIFSPAFGLTDDGTRPGQPGSAEFDREGLPHRRLSLVEGGVVREYLFNTREANAAERGEGSTGHASGGARGAPGIGTTNLVVEAGETEEARLLEAVERGILLSRFSGNSDPVSGDFSGVAKGSFLLRRGEPPRSIQETLISGNVYEMLAHVSDVGRERRRIDGNVLAPSLRLEGVSVTTG
jgi:PmbA protein